MSYPYVPQVPPATPVTPAAPAAPVAPKAGTLAEAVAWLIEQVKANTCVGAWEVVVTAPPRVVVTSTHVEDALRKAAAAAEPKPVRAEGLDVRLKGWCAEGVIFVVEGLG